MLGSWLTLGCVMSRCSRCWLYERNGLESRCMGAVGGGEQVFILKCQAFHDQFERSDFIARGFPLFL